MKHSLYSKLLKTYILVTVLSIVIASLFFYIFFKNYYFSLKEQQLISQGEKMAQILSPPLKDNDFNRSKELIDDYNNVNISRMWIVNKDGKRIGNIEETTTNHLLPKNDQLERAFKGEVVTDQGMVEFIDDPVLSVAIPIFVNGQVAGALFVCNPLEAITTGIIQALKIVIFAGIIAIIITIFVSYFISQSIAKPIKEITNSSLEMIKGNFTHQANVNSADEIGKLAETFNSMRHALDKSLHDLESEKNKIASMEKMQREFVANASHELRTPLTTVRGYIEALLDGVVTSKEKEKKYLKVILKETIRLHRLVNSLLDLSRIESGQIKINQQEVNLTDIINRTVAKFEPLAVDHSLTLMIDIPKVLPLVFGDEDMIEQVLINYLTNAIRYTPVDGTITIKAVAGMAEVNVHVIDTGIGIAPEDLAKVWKRFYKVDQARTLSKEGAGLGLSLVKEIVDRLNGRVWAESTLNQGSIFSFSLKRS